MRWLRTLLLGTFLLGGPGLPLLDALLFHGLGAERVAQQRLDVPGSARPHADTCVLAAPLPIPGPVPLVIGALGLSLEVLPLPCTLYPSSDVHAYESLSARPRAPPLSTI
jgi:hypothetical protein